MTRTIPGVLFACLCLSTTHGAAQQATVLDRVVAVVDGEAIFLSDLQRAEAMLGARGARDRALDYLIDRALLARLAEREGAVDDADVDHAIRNVRHQAGFPEEEFWAAVESQGFTRESYRSDVRRELGVLRVVNRRLPPGVSLETLGEERDRIRSELIRDLRARAEIDIRI